MTSPDEVLLQHMLDAIHDILDDTAGITYEIFVTAGQTARSVTFSLVTLGEASRQISDTTRQKFSHVPWRVIADTRNKLVHEYSSIDYPLVWQIVQHQLPRLQIDLREVLKQIGDLT